MNWKRYHILIVTAALCVTASAVLGFWLMKSRARNSDLEMEIQNLSSEEQRLTTQKIYPSKANLDALKKAQDEVVVRRNEFARLISAGQISAPSMMTAQFGDHVKRMVEQLRADAEAAKKGGEKGVFLVDPQFGFKEYFEGALPEAGEIPDLMLRLELIRHLSAVLFDAGISELVSIEAEKAAAPAAAAQDSTGIPGFGGAAPRTPGFGGFPGRPAGATATVQKSPEIIQKERMFEPVKLTIHVRVYEDHLWDLLNRLVADPNQIVVRNIELANTHDNLWPPFLRPGRAADRRQATAAPTRRPVNRIEAMLALADVGIPETPAEAAAIVPGLANRRVLATGGELISVVIDLTVYRLKAPITPAT